MQEHGRIENLKYRNFAVSSRSQGKSLLTLRSVAYAIATSKVLAIGTEDVDALYARIIKEYPQANLTKDLEHGLVWVNRGMKK